MNDFYVTLTNTNSTQFFPTNTPTNFRNVLPTPLDFSTKEYEVALTSIVIPNQYLLFPSSSLYVILVERKNRPNDPEKYKKVNHKIIFDNLKLYSVGDQVIDVDLFKDTINEKIKDHIEKNNIKGAFELSIKHGQAKIRKRGSTIEFVLSSGLRNVLGFNQYRRNKLLTNSQEEGEIPLDLYYFRHSAWVYCNAVAGQIVGSEITPLLRVIALSDFSGKRVYHHPIFNPQYTQVRRGTFPDLTISIRDEQGLNLKFFGGSVIVTLHFRPRSN